METFQSIHQSVVTGTLATFDRIIFKGHLLQFFPKGAFARFLAQQGVWLKDFSAYAQTMTEALKAHLEVLAANAQRPLIYLAKPATARTGNSKEEQARAIAARDGITDGLICVFSIVEPCQAFSVRPNRATHKLEVVREFRKCLHYYLYYQDPEFGFMHIRLQSWFPFEIQIYVNGREWLAQQLDARDIAYQRYDNKLTEIADLKTAQALCEKFAHRKWPRLLDAWAKRVNPHVALLRQASGLGYYWVVDQAEYATDVFFRDRASLEALVPALVTLSATAFSAEDVLRYLGRKPHGNFQGDLGTDLKRRPEGWRVKHHLKRNSIKWYDPANLLRIETTINNPREFRVLRVVDTPQGKQRRWQPMGKGVANFWRYAQVGAQSNARYLEALAHAQPVGKAIADLDRLCRPHTEKGKRYARFHPITAADCQLFAAALRGEHAITGFRNKDLQVHLYPTAARTPAEQRQRSARCSRWLAKLRGHGLIAKVKDQRLYRVTPQGQRLMAAALWCRHKEFPTAFFQATTA